MSHRTGYEPLDELIRRIDALVERNESDPRVRRERWLAEQERRQDEARERARRAAKERGG